MHLKKELLKQQSKSWALSRNTAKTTSLGITCLQLCFLWLCVTQHNNLLPHTQKEGCFVLKEAFNFSLPSPRCLNNVVKSSNLEASLSTLDFSRPYTNMKRNTVSKSVGLCMHSGRFKSVSNTSTCFQI